MRWWIAIVLILFGGSELTWSAQRVGFAQRFRDHPPDGSGTVDCGRRRWGSSPGVRHRLQVTGPAREASAGSSGALPENRLRALRPAPGHSSAAGSSRDEGPERDEGSERRLGALRQGKRRSQAGLHRHAHRSGGERRHDRAGVLLRHRSRRLRIGQPVSPWRRSPRRPSSGSWSRCSSWPVRPSSSRRGSTWSCPSARVPRVPHKILARPPSSGPSRAVPHSSPGETGRPGGGNPRPYLPGRNLPNPIPRKEP